MKQVNFPPSRQRGVAVHTILLVLSFLATGALAFLASRTPVDFRFMIIILSAALFFSLSLVLLYRLYALQNANYSLEIDHLTLLWGLRVEQIPVSDIEWVRPMTTLAAPLRLPLFRLPGSILGNRRHRDLGPVEFLASDEKSLLLVATRRRVFVISPEDVEGFLQNIQRAIEMGSLSPSLSQSVYPSSVVGLAWESSLVRYLWLAGLLLNIGLLAWISLISPDLGKISLGFLPSGAPDQAVPGSALILLPIVSLFVYIAGWLAGLSFYRREDQRSLANIVWTSGVFSTLLFLVAVLFIVTTPL